MSSAVSPPRYWPALDGLRALAVLAVVAFHAGAVWLPAGFLGVDVFFVISGFLITTLLLRESESSGAISLAGFWRRRAARLLPALLLMLAGVAAYLLLAAPELVARFLQDVRFALLFVTNWDFILREVPYFAQWQPSLGTHLWSLAVEEQFYLVWPLAVVAALRLGGRRAVGILALVLAVASALLMGLLYVPFADVSRVYFGTDTHAFGLAVGAGLAVLVRIRPHTVPGNPVLLTLAGSAALAGIIAAMALLHEWDGFLYRGGYLGIAILTGLAVVVATTEGNALVGFLSWRPLRWIGPAAPTASTCGTGRCCCCRRRRRWPVRSCPSRSLSCCGWGCCSGWRNSRSAWSRSRCAGRSHPRADLRCPERVGCCGEPAPGLVPSFRAWSHPRFAWRSWQPTAASPRPGIGRPSRYQAHRHSSTRPTRRRPWRASSKPMPGLGFEPRSRRRVPIGRSRILPARPARRWHLPIVSSPIRRRKRRLTE